MTEPEQPSKVKSSAIVLGVLIIFALVALFIFGVIRIGPAGGKVATDFKNQTISWESYKKEEDIFAVLNSLEEKKRVALIAWLHEKKYVRLDDIPTLRAAGFYKSSDESLINLFRNRVPDIDSSRNAEEQFRKIRERIRQIDKDKVISHLRTLSQSGNSPFQFLGDTYKAAAPDYSGFQPDQGYVYVRLGSELQRALDGKVARFYNKDSHRTLDLRVKSLAINGDVDVWFNKSQFCRLGLRQNIEPIEVGPSPLTYGNYDPRITDAHFSTSPLPGTKCSEVVAAVATGS